MIRILLSLLGFLIPNISHEKFAPTICSEGYRAVLYSTPIDFSRYQDIMAEMGYSSLGFTVLTYKYIIQYGRDTLIEIMDPGHDVKPFTGGIKILDYTKREVTSTFFIDASKTFYTRKDSILYSVEESKGCVVDLCEEVQVNTQCDSLLLRMSATQKEHKNIFNGTIPNLRSAYLFYPDIKYIPHKIFGIGPTKSTLTLEEIYYGKSVIDSIIQSYDYAGYQQITDADLSPADIQMARDLMEKVKSRE